MDKKTVFFIDVDNTLLDNDHIKKEIKKSLIRALGEEEANHFWQHHDSFREEKKLVDFPNIIYEYCAEKHKDTCDLTLGKIFKNIDFKHALYPKTIEILKYLKTLGKVILFTEGDSVYQKRKVEQSGLGELADEVLLFEQKWEHFADLIKRHKKRRIVIIEDRAESLVKMKKQFPDILTVEVLQGHYSTINHRKHEKVDLKVNTISELSSLFR